MTFTRKEFVMGLVVVFTLWISSFFAIRNIFPEISDSGAFGDTFGAINSLFSGLALFGIVISIFMQREELRLQREELRMTRDELAKAAEAQQKQVDIQISLAKLTAYGALLPKGDNSKSSSIQTFLTAVDFKDGESYLKEEIKEILESLK